jgi:hypothetical protein
MLAKIGLRAPTARWLLLVVLAAGCGSSETTPDLASAAWDASANIPSGNFSGDLCRNSLPACTHAGDFQDCDVGSPLGPYCCTCEPVGGWLCNLYCPANQADMSVVDGGGSD